MKTRYFPDILKKIFGERVKINESLFKHTTFQIGGPADFFVEVRTHEEMVKTLKLARKYNLPIFILGGGSNILVDEGGFHGLVIKNKIEGIKIMGYQGGKGVGGIGVRTVKLEVGSGTKMNGLVRFTVEEGLEGLESFLGLPGTIGGAIAGNSHWKEKKVNRLLRSLTVVRKGIRGNREIGEGEKEGLVIRSGEIILSAVFELRKGNKKELWKKAEEAMEYRKKTQPLEFPSAGCIFKNISKAEAVKLKTPGLTRSAGYLIDQGGLKGKQIGGAQISLLHANFIINKDKARATDVVELITLMKSEVNKKFKVILNEEIIHIGF